MTKKHNKHSERKEFPLALKYILGIYLAYLGITLIHDTLLENSGTVFLLIGILIVAVSIVYLIAATRWLISDLNSSNAKESPTISEEEPQPESCEPTDGSENPFV